VGRTGPVTGITVVELVVVVVVTLRFLRKSLLCVCVYIYIYIHTHISYSRSGSSVGIATDYGLDGPGSNPGEGEIFRPSRPALGPTQPPVKWVPVLSGSKVRPGRGAVHSPPSSAVVMEE